MEPGDQIEALRVLPLEGLFNVRDLGGYAAGERQVKWGRLYRSGDLGGLSDQARRALEARRIRTIVDFRDESEREHSPDGDISTVKQNHPLPIDAGNIIDLSAVGRGVDGETLMAKLYQALADKARPQYRAFFSILAGEENAPLLFHCSAGKDRTGLGAALLLSALGVDREIILQDYLLSGTCLEGKYAEWLSANPHLEPVMSVRPGYLLAALSLIDRDLGGMEAYLRDLGADIKTLRRLYTE
jgi:protein-tyrosine phosphatase